MSNIEAFKSQVIKCNQIDWESLNTLGIPYETHESYIKPDKDRLVGLRQRDSGNWQAIINVRVRGEQKSLGTFAEKWDAICARKSAENQYNL